VTETAGLVRLYAAFNSRDVERLLTLVTDDVDWPDGRPGCTARTPPATI
jgi:hypothetical protein